MRGSPGSPADPGPLVGLTVVMAGGGTGGHLYPGLAVADLLRRRGARVLFAGTRRGLGGRVIPEAGYPLLPVMARGLGGGPLGLVRSLLEAGVGVAQSLGWLLRVRPRVVVGTGGYASAPMVLAAALVGIPSVLMEQNALPGKVTRWLSRFASAVCVSFPGMEGWFPGVRVVCTGNPVRGEILTRSREEARQALDLEPGRLMLLVTGASQGAASLNRAVLAALEAWGDKPWTVHHLTGPGHLEEVEREARGMASSRSLDYRPHAYLEDMACAYAAADLVVARAGATTLAELTVRGLPVILVPYPFSADRHQDVNAEVMERAGAAVVLADAEVEGALGRVVSGLLEDPEGRQRMAARSRALGEPAAAEKVVEVILREASSGWKRGGLG